MNKKKSSSFRTKVNKFQKKLRVWRRNTLRALGVLAVLSMVIFIYIVIRDSKQGQPISTLGVQAVMAMYDFGDLNELDDNMDVLRELTTTEVYNMLTLDRTDRALNVYLKFKNKPTRVLVEESTDSYVIYSLKTDSISATRKFAFFFRVGDSGKIEYVREAEVVDFSTNSASSPVGS